MITLLLCLSEWIKQFLQIVNAVPILSEGSKTAKDINPLNKAKKINIDVHPHIGQIVINNDIMDIIPVTVPIDINLGLYSSTLTP